MKLVACVNSLVERAQYEVELAQRRYLKVDPNNRLVASVLEAEWNAKLVALEEARAIEERYNQSDQQRVSAEEQADIKQVPERFRQFWNDSKTTARQRKRAVRLVIEDVTVHKTDRICCPYSLQRRGHTDDHGGASPPISSITLNSSRHVGCHGPPS